MERKHRRQHQLRILIATISRNRGTLDGLGRRFADGVGVFAAAVSADHFHTGVLIEPVSERLGAAVGKNIHY
jgi:hypothetical protein